MTMTGTDENPQENPASFPSPPGGADDPGAALASDLLENAPVPSPGYIARLNGEAKAENQEEKKRARIAKIAGAMVDKDGYIFDRNFCVLGHGKRPRKTAGGLWEMRKDPDTGNRYKREERLRRSGSPQDDSRPAPKAAPRPALILDDEAGGSSETGAPGFDPTAGPGGSPAMTEARALAVMIDGAVWSVAHFLADSEMVARTQAQVSPSGVEVLAAGLSTYDNLPQIPWYVGAGLVYAPALAALVMHEKSAPKRNGFFEKIKLGWAWMRGYSRGNKNQRKEEAPAGC